MDHKIYILGIPNKIFDYYYLYLDLSTINHVKGKTTTLDSFKHCELSRVAFHTSLEMLLHLFLSQKKLTNISDGVDRI